MILDFSLTHQNVTSVVQLYNSQGLLVIQDLIEKGHDKIEVPPLEKGKYLVIISNKIQKSSTTIQVK